MAPAMLQQGAALTANFTLANGLITKNYHVTPKSAYEGRLDEFLPHMARFFGEGAGVQNSRPICADSSRLAPVACRKQSANARRVTLV